jgi:hypothetical protein
MNTRRFRHLAAHLETRGIPMPRIFASDTERVAFDLMCAALQLHTWILNHQPPPPAAVSDRLLQAIDKLSTIIDEDNKPLAAGLYGAHPGCDGSASIT